MWCKMVLPSQPVSMAQQVRWEPRPVPPTAVVMLGWLVLTMVVAVWVGFDKGKSMGLGGSQAALPIWADWMGAKGGSRPEAFDIGSSLVEKDVCLDWELCETEDVDLFQKGQSVSKYEQEPESSSELCTLTHWSTRQSHTTIFGWGKKQR